MSNGKVTSRGVDGGDRWFGGGVTSCEVGDDRVG